MLLVKDIKLICFVRDKLLISFLRKYKSKYHNKYLNTRWNLMLFLILILPCQHTQQWEIFIWNVVYFCVYFWVNLFTLPA